MKTPRYLTAKELAQDLEVGKSRVTKLVDGLMDKDLVEKLDDPRDGRVKLLCLTAKGRDKMDRIDEFITGLHARVLDQLETPQRAIVFTSLEQLRTAMEAVRDQLGIGD